MSNPVPVIPLQYATAESRGRRISWVFVACAAGGWVACAATWLFIRFGDIRVVVLAGPVIFAAGLAALAGGLHARAAWVSAAGIAHCSICALFVGLVNLLGWGPSDARQPFLFMGAAYCVLALPLTIVAVCRRGATQAPPSPGVSRVSPRT
jgi:hypothetical protein